MTSYPRFDGTQACTNLTPDLVAAFDGVASPERAIKVCIGCAFLSACRGYALDHDVVGVWGGTTDPDRQHMRAEKKIPPPPRVTAELDALVHAWRSGAEASRVDPADVQLVPSLLFAS